MPSWRAHWSHMRAVEVPLQFACSVLPAIKDARRSPGMLA